MIVAITNFQLPKTVTHEEARSIFLTTAPTYQGVKGLLRKSYLVAQDGNSVGGIYFWNSRAEAEAMFTESWRAYVREKYYCDPSVTYFDSPVMVDNISHEILSDA